MAILTDQLTYGYCEITKTEKTPDGLMIWGKAAGSGLDLDGQRFNAKYLQKAVPQWMEWGNIREQHSAIAAGVAQVLEQRGDEYYIKALIVDPTTIKKVETKVLKGLSPGVKNGRIVKSLTAPNGEIVGGDMVEISLVDRPADPTNRITICKAAGGTFLPVDEDGEVLDDMIVKGAGSLTADQLKTALTTVNGLLEGDLLKEVAEADDIDKAEEVIRQLALLVQSEAAGLAQSLDMGEVRDIQHLLDAVRCLEMFIEREQREDHPDDDDHYAEMRSDVTAYKALLLESEDELIEKLATAMIAKGVKVMAPEPNEDGEDDNENDKQEDDTEDDDETDGDRVTKAASRGGVDPDTLGQLLTKVAGLEASLQSALESSKADATKVKDLEAELKKFASMPVPGGPHLVAPTFKATRPDERAATHYRSLSQDSNLSPDVQAGYRELADRMEGLTVG